MSLNDGRSTSVGAREGKSVTDAFLDFDDEMNVKRLVVEDFRLGFSVKGEDGYESGA